MTAHPGYDFSVSVAGHEAVPVSAVYEADEAARAKLMARFGLLALEKYVLNYSISPAGSGWLLNGRLLADAAQPCIVTLEAVPQHVDARFEVRFFPEGAPELAALEDEEQFADPEAEDIDQMTGSFIPVGETAAQYFSLALDPYPRSPGADSFLAKTESLVISEEEDLRRRSPFAALAAKKEDSGKA